MLTAFVRAFRTPDLRKKILFTMGIMAVFRLGSVFPTPGVDYQAVQRCIDAQGDNSLYSLINLFSGGALLQLSVFALGIMPYITASIIVQLLVVVIPRFEALKKEGQSGTAKLTQYTRYLTIGLAVLQSTGLIALARQPGQLFTSCPNENIIYNDLGAFGILLQHHLARCRAMKAAIGHCHDVERNRTGQHLVARRRRHRSAAPALSRLGDRAACVGRA